MTRFVAEIGSNHNGDYDRAQALIDSAAACGFDMVKLQYWRPERLYAPEALARFTNDVRSSLVRHTMPLVWVAPLAARAKSLGMRFGCSVFDVEGLRELVAAVPLDFLKVSSYSVLDARLQDAVRATGLPVVLSVGMATDEEIIAAAKRLHPHLTVLHCVSSYPVLPQDCWLRRIDLIRRQSGLSVRVGWSDHSVSAPVLYAAVLRWSAEMVEVHLDLDGDGSEAAHSWKPDAIATAIVTLRVAEDTGGGLRSATDDDERIWRADPSDGLRPRLEARAGHFGQNK